MENSKGKSHHRKFNTEKSFLFLLNFLIILPAVIIACATNRDKFQYTGHDKFRIAFGSCSNQNKPQPVLERVVEIKPDLFIYLGDNVYNTSFSVKTLRACYKKLGEKNEFIALKRSVPILPVWDDHDYGWNDMGNDYPYREESKKIFLEFFGVPDRSILRHKGIYYSRMFHHGYRTIQVIMLDLRTFRDPLLPYNNDRDDDKRFSYKMDYSPHIEPGPTMMGEKQWKWFERQLLREADLRIIASSTQFGITYNGYEAWANFPHEQQKMIDLIKKTRAEGVLFISGDAHYAEISVLTADNIYPLYDITSSGITSRIKFATPNDNRIDGPFLDNNFGLIEFNVNMPDPEIRMEIIDAAGIIRISRLIKLSSLAFSRANLFH